MWKSYVGERPLPWQSRRLDLRKKTGVQVEEESDERKTDFRGGKLLQTLPSTPKKQVHML